MNAAEILLMLLGVICLGVGLTSGIAYLVYDDSFLRPIWTVLLSVLGLEILVTTMIRIARVP